MIVIYILLAVCVLTLSAALAFLLWPLKHPLPTESDYSHHSTPWWHLYYSKKYFRSIRGAEKNSGLEEYFAGMTFEFERSDLRDVREISVRATGDLMARRDLVGDGGRRLWDDVGEYLFSGDLRIGNMEFAVNPDRFILKLIRFSVPPSFAEPLLGDSRFGTFDVVTLANNHINDSLSEGITSTCDYLDSIGMTHVGANRSADEQDKFPILEVKGVRIAVLSYTFSTNNLPLEPGFEFGTNLVRFNALQDEDYDPSLILRHIKLARERGAEYIISCHHWGIEFEYYPPRRIVRRAEELFEAGVDLIIGHHPHGLNPVGQYRTKDGRDCIAFYSLGNLTAAGLPFAMQNLGELGELVLETGFDGSGAKVVRPIRIVLTPVFFSPCKGPNGPEPRVLSVKKNLEAIRSGNVPDHLRRRAMASLQYVGREFERYFLPRGVEWR